MLGTISDAQESELLAVQELWPDVPMIVMPFSHDQPDNARRAQALGTARVLPARRYTAERAAPLLAELLKRADIQDNCRAVAGRFQGSRSLEAARESPIPSSTL